MDRRPPVTRGRLTLLLVLVAASVFLAVVPSARTAMEAARREHARVEEQIQGLRVRLADLDRRRLEDRVATAATGAGAARALRKAVLAALDGLPVTDVEIATTPADHGVVGARCRAAARGRLPDLLRVTRRLAAPTSGILLERVSLGAGREGVDLEVWTEMLRQSP
jgi:hypothetical protein